MFKNILPKFMRFLCMTAKNVKPEIETPKKGSNKSITPVAERSYLPHIKVSILGADTQAGRTAAFLLKQHPLISKLFLGGNYKIQTLAKDLQKIDTSCRVEGFEGYKNIPEVLRAADIVLIMDMDKNYESIMTKFHMSAPRIIRLAKSCTIHCPQAVVIVCVEPVYCIVPLFERIFIDSPWYEPIRLIGSAAKVQSLANSVAARFLHMDPNSVHVPLLGGTDSETMIPLLSTMTPQIGLGLTELECLSKLILSDAFDTKLLDMCEGFGVARLAICVARGLCLYEDAVTSALVSTNIAGKLRHIVTTVRFGEHGITENYGIPNLNQTELDQFEQALVKMNDRKRITMNYKLKKVNFAIKSPV